MLQTTCECGRTMRANSEKDFIEQVTDHLRHNHPERSRDLSPRTILGMVEISTPRNG